MSSDSDAKHKLLLNNVRVGHEALESKFAEELAQVSKDGSRDASLERALCLSCCLCGTVL